MTASFFRNIASYLTVRKNELLLYIPNMKILQFHNKVPYPPKDGGSIATWNFSVELAKQKNELTLFCINTSKHFFDIKNIPSEFTSLFRVEAVYLDTKISWIHAIQNLFFSKLPYNAKRFISKEVKKKLIELLIEKKYDVIQVEGLYCMPYLRLFRKYSDALVSFRSHNIENEIWFRMASNTENFFKRKYLKILANRIKEMELEFMRISDVNIPITIRDAEYISKISEAPCHISPVGLNLQQLHSFKNEKFFSSIFFIGALDWIPNQEGILWFVENVWPQILESGISCPLEVAGRNCPEWLKEKLSAIPQLVFHGEVENAYTFMNERALMIVPLFSGSGMRVKIIEGMALGKAIISTSIGAEGIPVTNNENIFITDSPESFAQTILMLVNDLPKITVIGKKASDFAIKNYDISNIVTQLTEFWKNNLKN